MHQPCALRSPLERSVQIPCKWAVYPALGVTIQHMRNPAIGLLRSDMAELQDAWEVGQATRAEGWELDPRHDSTLYASLVLLGMHGLIELGRLCHKQGKLEGYT